jgi:hypothetical protein
MGAAARRLARPGAAQRAAELLEQLAQRTIGLTTAREDGTIS